MTKKGQTYITKDKDNVETKKITFRGKVYLDQKGQEQKEFKKQIFGQFRFSNPPQFRQKTR